MSTLQQFSHKPHGKKKCQFIVPIEIAGTGSQTGREVPPLNNSLPVSLSFTSLPSVIIQPILYKKPGEKVCDPGVVEILKRENACCCGLPISGW
jgi:hypothetical protein